MIKLYQNTTENIHIKFNSQTSEKFTLPHKQEKTTFQDQLREIYQRYAEYLQGTIQGQIFVQYGTFEGLLLLQQEIQHFLHRLLESPPDDDYQALNAFIKEHLPELLVSYCDGSKAIQRDLEQTPSPHIVLPVGVLTPARIASSTDLPIEPLSIRAGSLLIKPQMGFFQFLADISQSEMPAVPNVRPETGVTYKIPDQPDLQMPNFVRSSTTFQLYQLKRVLFGHVITAKERLCFLKNKIVDLQQTVAAPTSADFQVDPQGAATLQRLLQKPKFSTRQKYQIFRDFEVQQLELELSWPQLPVLPSNIHCSPFQRGLKHNQQTNLQTSSAFDFLLLQDPFNQSAIQIAKKGNAVLAYNQQKNCFEFCRVVRSASRDTRFHYVLEPILIDLNKLRNALQKVDLRAQRTDGWSTILDKCDILQLQSVEFNIFMQRWAENINDDPRAVQTRFNSFKRELQQQRQAEFGSYLRVVFARFVVVFPNVHEELLEMIVHGQNIHNNRTPRDLYGYWLLQSLCFE